MPKKELIDEDEQLVAVLESDDKDDDKKELAKQKKELEDYKNKSIKKSFEILGL